MEASASALASRALSVKPDFILCDEPISALDVSVQAQVVNMLQDIQEETGVTYLFIAHDLSMVRHISDRIGVMYLGNIVEIADSEDLYTKPAHPYTQALLSSMPEPDPTNTGKERIILEGEVPSPPTHHPAANLERAANSPLKNAHRKYRRWLRLRKGMKWLVICFRGRALGLVLFLCR